MKGIQVPVSFSVALILVCSWLFSDGTTAQALKEPADEKRKAAAEEEIYQGACAFDAKDFAQAQRRFEKALATSPEDARLPLYLARSLHAQAVKGNSSVLDHEKAKAAIKAYENALAKNAEVGEALGAVLRLYEQMNQNEQARDWLRQQANSNALSTKQRSDLFTLLANRFWDAYYKITHSTTGRPSKPANSGDMDKARQYVQQGLEAVEKALQLRGENRDAWENKSMLLRAKAAIAGLENEGDEQARLNQSAEEVEAKFKKSSAAILAELINSQPTDGNLDSPADQQKEQLQMLADLVEFQKSGVFKRRGEPDALIGPIEDYHWLLIPPPPPPPPAGKGSRSDREAKPLPEPFDPEQERLIREEERRAKRLAKLPWKLISPPGKGFSVLLPSPVVEGESRKDFHTYSVSAEGVDYSLMWQVLDKPKHIKPENDLVITTIALATARAFCGMSASGGNHCEVVIAKDLARAGSAGRQYSVTYTNCRETETGVMEVFISPSSSYVLWVMGAGETDPRVAKFLRSFTLKGTAKAK